MVSASAWKLSNCNPFGNPASPSSAHCSSEGLVSKERKRRKRKSRKRRSKWKTEKKKKDINSENRRGNT